MSKKRKDRVNSPPPEIMESMPNSEYLEVHVEDLVNDIASNLRAREAKAIGDHHRELVENHPEMVFALVELLLEKYAPDGRQRELPAEYQACFMLLEHGLTEIRFSVERNRPWALEMNEEIQHKIAVEAFQTQVDVRVQSDLLEALHSAKLELHPEIRARHEEQAEYYQRFNAGRQPQMPEDAMREAGHFFDQLARDVPDNPFTLLEMVSSQFATLPSDGQILTCAGMLYASEPLIHDLSVLTLLHPDAEVRQALLEIHNSIASPHNMTPVGLRRLIGMRNWLPEAERGLLDNLIRKLRKEHLECASLPEKSASKCYASPFDGSGTQGCWLIGGARSNWTLSGALFRQDEGVREGWLQDGLKKKEIDVMLGEMRSNAGAFPASLEFVNLLAPHFIQLGLEQEQPPPATMLGVAEQAGKGYWNPERLDLEASLEQFKSADPEAFTPAQRKKILNHSGRWHDEQNFAYSWFEDDAEVDELLEERISEQPVVWMEKLSRCAELILQEVIEPKRAMWMERLVWMAYWARSLEGKRKPAWQPFAVLAELLNRDTPLEEIPLMVKVAETSVHSAWQRAEKDWDWF